MTARSLILAFCLFWPPAAALAQDAPSAPHLRIEPGMHIAPIMDAETDQARDLLVTSGDSTVRIWALPELRLLRVLRPPIGPSNAGTAGAVALTPDGKIAAVGGWPSGETGQYAVDLFDVATGQLVRQFKADEPVVALAFSGDGLRLAAGLYSKGIRVWHMADGTVEEDRDYPDQVQALDFGLGRLAVASLDGAVRLYAETSQDAGLHPSQRVATEAGRTPWSLRFSPDGRSLAIAFEDKTAVEVRSASDLSLEAKPDVGGLAADQGFYAAAWSLDSSTVFAGGGVSQVAGSNYQVFAWANRGTGPRRVASSGSDQVISAIWTLRDPDSFVTADTSPTIQVFTDGNSRIKKQKPQANFAYLAQGANEPAVFNISDDGTVVETGYFGSPNRPIHLDVSTLSVQQLDAPTPGLGGWQSTAGDMRVEHFAYDEHPELNGQPLGLERADTAYSVDVRNNRVLVGSQSALSLFGASGHKTWSIPTTAAFRVAQSPDGRLVVAAHDDGTVRWYRASDGAELMAVFVLADDKRWVAFTPGGYYAAGPGAEDLVGWQVNHGPEQAADFFPASKFRERFYRPDVVSLVLKTLDETEAVRQADAAAARGEPEAAQQAPAAQPQAEAAQAAPAAQPQAEAAQAAPAAQPQAESGQAAPAAQPQAEAAQAAPAAQPQAGAPQEAPAAQPEAEASQQAPTAQPQAEAAQQTQAPQPEAPTTAQQAPAAQHEAEAAQEAPAAQNEAAPPPVASLPTLAPVRVILHVAKDDVSHARRAADVRQALAAAGLEVADRVPVDAGRSGPSIRYYFQSDRKAAAEVSHVLEPLLGAVAPAPIRKRANLPEPGAIEVAIP
jgi:WD40 repeat protein